MNSPVYTIATYIMGVLTTFVSYLGYSILAVAIAYQYGHAADKLGDEGITSQINDFDNLANDGRNNSGNNDDTGKTTTPGTMPAITVTAMEADTIPTTIKATPTASHASTR